MVTRKNALIDRLNQIAYLLLCVIVFDCMAMGGGAYLHFGGLDIRMWFFIAFFLVSVPGVLRNLKNLLCNRYVLILIVWAAWIAFSTARGIMLGNRKDMILSGLIGFASFVLLPGTVTVLNTKERVLGLMRITVAASIFLSLQSFFFLTVYNFFRSSFYHWSLFALYRELGRFSDVDHSVVRLMFLSQPLLFLGCGSALYLGIHSKGWKRWVYRAAIALSFMSILYSYTRSIYLGLGVCAILLVAILWFTLDKAQVKTMWKTVGASLLLFAVLLVGCKVVYGGDFINYGIFRTVGVNVKAELMEHFGITLPTEPTEVTDPAETTDSTQETTDVTEPTQIWDPYDKNNPAYEQEIFSGDIRDATELELYQHIKEHPLLGSGMGAVLKVRENIDGYNEYFYLDQAFKTGITGILLYMLPMILMAVELFRKKRRENPEDLHMCAVFFSALAGVAMFCTLNPYLNGSNGITLYCCTIAVMSINQTKTIKKV